MKTATTVILSGCALAIALPASADGISLSKGIEACKAELSRHEPALKRYRVDYEESLASDRQMWIAFNALDGDGVMAKFVCTVDRVTRTAAVERKRPRMSDYTIAAPRGNEKLAHADQSDAAR